MIILQVHVLDREGVVDSEGEPPVPGEGQGPDARAIPRQPVCAKVGRRQQFILCGDGVEIGQDIGDPAYQRGGQTLGFSRFREMPQSLVPDAFDLHVAMSRPA